MGGFEDGFLAIRIMILANRVTTHQIHLPPQESLQLFLHRNVVEKAPATVGSKGREKIHITIRPEILTQRGAKNFQPRDPPLAAEGRDGLGRQFDGQCWHGHGYFASSFGTSSFAVLFGSAKA